MDLEEEESGEKLDFSPRPRFVEKVVRLRLNLY